MRKLQFAVPWFVHKRTLASGSDFDRSLADILAKSFKFHGVIDIIPTSKYKGSQQADWRGLGADFAVLGAYEQHGNTLSLELRLFDVADDTMLIGKSYSGHINQKTEMLYRFCDTVMKDLTGTNGLCTTQIAFISQPDNQKGKEVFLSDILGTNFRQVTRHKNLVVSPRFSPDGTLLAYTSYHTGNQNLYITDLRQNKITRVLSQRQGMNLAPGWSPDGGQFTLTLSYRGNPDLYLLNQNGQILRQLTENTGINVSGTFSPDGKRIVFVSDRSGSPHLYVMDIKSGATQRISYSGSENAEPDWHPSQDLIVYSSLRNGVYQIITQKPEVDAEPVQLTSDLSHHESPSWSPDGNQIIFSKQDGRNNKVYAIMKDGSFQRKIIDIPGSQTYPQWSGNYK